MNSTASAQSLHALLADASPLMGLDMLQSLMRLGRRQAMEAIESGRLRGAFSIGRASSAAEEIRVFKGSLIEYWAAARELSLRRPEPLEGPELAEALAACLPTLQGRPARFVTVTGASLQKTWSCSKDLIADLIADRELTAVGEADGRGSAVVTYNSALEFLQRRKK